MYQPMTKRMPFFGAVMMVCCVMLLWNDASTAQEEQRDEVGATTESTDAVSPHATPPPPVVLSDEQDVLTIFFSEGRSVLTSDARRALDQLVPMILEHLTAGGAVRVLGYYAGPDITDETPFLAARRAEAVTTYLHEAWGIDPRRFNLGHRVGLPREGGHGTSGSASRVELLRPVGLRHLNLDDFGGALNPLEPQHRR